jgi:hypothetical protein
VSPRRTGHARPDAFEFARQRSALDTRQLAEVDRRAVVEDVRAEDRQHSGDAVSDALRRGRRCANLAGLVVLSKGASDVRSVRGLVISGRDRPDLDERSGHVGFLASRRRTDQRIGCACALRNESGDEVAHSVVGPTRDARRDNRVHFGGRPRDSAGLFAT